MFAGILPAQLTGVLTFFLMWVNTVLWGGLIVLPSLFKFLIPIEASRRLCSRIAVRFATNWVAGNRLVWALLHRADGHLTLEGTLDPSKNYLLVCNHQEWTDILILFNAFHARTPLLRFFMKYELLYVPIVGTGCWAMDFPFMKRHTRAEIEANPTLAQEDLETTRRACEVYKTEPVTVVNFLEGTRFSEAKRLLKQSPYQHLLRPKSAGMAFALGALGDQLDGIIDVTLVYRPVTGSRAWSWFCGQQEQLALHAVVRPIPPEMIAGSYDTDAAFRAQFQDWVNDLWAQKDARFERLRAT